MPTINHGISRALLQYQSVSIISRAIRTSNFEGVTIMLFAQNFSYDITHYESWWIIVRGGICPSTEFRKFPDKVHCFT